MFLRSVLNAKLIHLHPENEAAAEALAKFEQTVQWISPTRTGRKGRKKQRVTIIMSAHPITDEEAVAAADKEMEERANRAKELLSNRYVGLKRQQVRKMLLGFSKCTKWKPVIEEFHCLFHRFYHFHFTSHFCCLRFLWSPPIVFSYPPLRKPVKAGKCSWNAK